jgi:hypothetical protein
LQKEELEHKLVTVVKQKEVVTKELINVAGKAINSTDNAQQLKVQVNHLDEIVEVGPNSSSNLHKSSRQLPQKIKNS